MSFYGAELKELKQKVQRKEYLERTKISLEKQKTELEEKSINLKKVMEKEQRDIEKVEGKSLAALFYNVVGKKEEKIEKERSEAYMAAVKYDTAIRELEMVNEDIKKANFELDNLRNCENKYQDIFTKTIIELKNNNQPESIEILKLEEEIAEIDNQIKETKEAIEAGKKAKDTTYDTLLKLDDADGYATWDAFGGVGGGIFADMMKHDALDEAQEMIEELQITLRRFETELDDVAISADIQVNFDSFSRFADIFFDNIFVNWEIMEQIEDSVDVVEGIFAQIQEALQQLDEKEKALEIKKIEFTDRIEQLVIGE